MDYPVWDLAFGGGLLVAVISIVHVFVSHFAVGGGLFLVLTEQKAYRDGDEALLAWLKRHTKFFVLLTVVFGAVTGVGIWFTIGLVQPAGTSALIHAFLWGWAIEWVFFFLEITAALLYLYGWERLDRRTHLWYGWIYFIAAFASMVVINGIVTFMLTPGTWLATHAFWEGFFNPTFAPSLCIRFVFSLALAGLYAFLTASACADPAHKRTVVRWSGAWIVPAFVALPFLAWWYAASLPAEAWSRARGPFATATAYTTAILVFSVLTAVLAAVALLRPARLRAGLALAVLLAAFGTMWAFEFVRECVRKPYVIAGYMYGNALYAHPASGDGGFTVEALDHAGVLRTAKWVASRDPANRVAAGRDLFLVECQSCHTEDAYRGLRAFLAHRAWDAPTLRAMLGSIDLMRGGVMPPFAGTAEELEALAAFLETLAPPGASAAPPGGAALFDRYCEACHTERARDRAIARLASTAPATLDAALADLQAVFVRMPALKLNADERAGLTAWIRAQAARAE
jgi:mono/diheme cytochrome c family protein